MKRSLQNVVGPQVRALRRKQGMTQDALAARCGTLGWDATENTITKIETQLRCVTDREMILLARALRVRLHEFFPEHTKLFQ